MRIRSRSGYSTKITDGRNKPPLHNGSHLNVKSKCWPNRNGRPNLPKPKEKLKNFPTKKATPPMQNSPTSLIFFSTQIWCQPKEISLAPLCVGGSAVCLWCTEKSGSGSWLHCALQFQTVTLTSIHLAAPARTSKCAPGNKIDIVPSAPSCTGFSPSPQGG